MRQLKIFPFSLVVILLATACGSTPTVSPPTIKKSTPTMEEQQSLSTDTPAPTGTATPTAKPLPTATTDPGKATNNPAVNATIIALLDQNIDTQMGAILLNAQPCTTQDGLGGPPKCPEGVADDTMLSFLPVIGPGEGSHLDPDKVERVFDYQEPVLFAVVLLAPPEIYDPVFPEGSYAVILHTQPNDFARTFRLTDEGKIVRVDYTAWSTTEELTYIEGEILYKK